MKNRDDESAINRRDFIKIGVAGAATIGLSGVGGLLNAAEPAAAPAYRTLGRTGLKVTTLSFGAMLTPEPEVIRAGFDMGINYVDTARRYLNGRSEDIVSKALQGIRDKVYIATKTKRESTTKDEVMKDIETSLKELKTDHIDVIQLHGLENGKQVLNAEAREAYVKAKEQGKVRFFGVSTHTNMADIVNAVVDDPDKFFDTVLVQYNFNSDPAVKQALAKAKGRRYRRYCHEDSDGRLQDEGRGENLDSRTGRSQPEMGAPGSERHLCHPGHEDGRPSPAHVSRDANEIHQHG